MQGFAVQLYICEGPFLVSPRMPNFKTRDIENKLPTQEKLEFFNSIGEQQTLALSNM